MPNDFDDLQADRLPPPLPPMPPPLPEPPPPPEIHRHRLEFTGRAGEYFGIWFVNLVLSVLTLGIYSAWAKVRTERYFYGNTRLAGAPFEYLANPIAILKGRLIAYAVAIALGLTAHFQLFIVYIPLVLVVLLLLPWLVQRTLRFRARYSAWRGLRFRFVDGVFEAYVNFMFKPILSAFTLQLLSPWVRMGQQEYLVAGHRFGGKRFRFNGDLGQYYVPFLIAIGLGIGLYIVGALLAVAGGGLVASMDHGNSKGPGTGGMVAIFLPIILAYLALLTLPIFLRTRYTNLMWNFTRLEGHRFESTLRARDVIWIFVSNGLAIVLSLGLLVPWAMVRLAKYRAAHFTLLASGDLDHFVAERAFEEGAAGAELLDALDMDMDVSI